MSVVKYIKLLASVLGIAALNIVVFSPGLLGVRLGSSALSSAFGATVLMGSLLCLVYSLYFWVIKTPTSTSIRVSEINTHEDYVQSFLRYRRVKVLAEDVSMAVQQLDRMQKKQATLAQLLMDRFDPAELTHKKFSAVIKSVEEIFYSNLKSVLNRLHGFDASEFESLAASQTSRLSPQLIQERRNIYNEYLTFTQQALSTNEEILLKLDKLILEISRLDRFDVGEIEELQGMQEIDTLIKQTQYYKD